MSNPPPRGRGLSLYANLLDPTAATPSSVSKGPVIFKNGGADGPGEDASAKKPQIDAAALRFQPTRRPQLSNQKPKPKPKSAFPKAASSDAGIAKPSAPAAPTAFSAQRPPAKSTLADWTAVGDDDDVNGFYGGGEKRQRGGRKRRKKNKEEYAVAQDWDDIYDPARPNNYEEYKHSDEKIREVREWKDRLYAHRIARQVQSDKDSDDEEPYRPQMGKQFAPPPSYSFAPPPMDSPPPKPAKSPQQNSYSPKLTHDAVPARVADVPDLSLASVIPGAISRAPVRYNLPPAPSELPASEAELKKALEEEPDDDDDDDDDEQGAIPADDTPRSTRPGQKGFAERLMSKYGWSKGSGLGADGSGIINPLSVKVEKRKKKSDAEGGGFREPAGRGKIIGGQRRVPDKKESEAGKFGVMSEVIVLRGMVDGMNLDEEVDGSGDGGLIQEIGDECSEKYGRVERVYIDRHGATPKVFIKFTSQLSGLRAVNALEGRIFNGNTISALFYDAETFEKGIYE